MKRCLAAIAAALALAATPAAALTDFSFAGSFADDDDVQFFDFTVGAPSTVTLISFSYAGGTQADGTVVSAGGFDPILAVFDSGGFFIADNDDGSSPDVGIDPVTGNEFDTYLEVSLVAGDYTVAVSQFDNFALGDRDDGFTQEGFPTFTSLYGCSNGKFCDFDGDNRTNAWNFDIRGVEDATVRPPVGEIPLPAAAPLLLAGLAGLGWAARRR